MTPDTDFLDLLNRHQALLRKVCRAYALSAVDQQDLYQDMVLQLWKAWPHFRRESKESTWMYQIALHVAISGIRKRTPGTAPISDALQISADSNTRDEEQIEHLFRSLHQLTQVERALVLLYFEEKTIDEMAEISGMTPNHIRVKMHRIREKLRSLLQKTAST
jgi:RNA polymerase sigma factor (sigma-70 family)